MYNDLITPVLWNRNRNPRNRNFLPCGTGTETVINYGSGTVIKWYHKSSHKHTVNNCLFYFLHLTLFSFTFYKKFDETYKKIFLSKSLECKKARFFQKKIFKILIVPSRIQGQKTPDPGSTAKNVTFLNLNNCNLLISSWKNDPGYLLRIYDADFSASRIQGSKKNRIRNTFF